MAESNNSTTTTSPEQQPPPLVIHDAMTSFGWTQLSQSILVALSLFIDSQQSFISVFADATPPWHCTDPAACSATSDLCKIPTSSWTYDAEASSATTIISQWGLQCASSFVTGFPQSSFFVGCLIGGFFLGTLADSSLGRKNLLLISCFSMSLASTLITFSTNVWVYSVFKFMIGFFRSSIGTCTLVLLAEKVGKKWRFRVGILAFFCFSTGFLTLPAIAYANRDNSWRFLYLWTSIPGFVYSVCVYFFLTESPRWLIMQGRAEEAMAVLRSGIGGGGGGELAEKLLNFPIKQRDSSTGGVYSSISKILERNWAIRRTAAVMVLAFGTGMVYFGMPLGAGNLGFNIYLAVTLNAFLEFPSYIATYLLENCKRRVSLLASTTLCGVLSVTCGVVAAEGAMPATKIGLELGAFFCGSTVCNVVLIYATELFPTSVRNTGTALVRQAMVCGAIFGPVLASVGRKSEVVSYGVFGGVIMLCGFSVAHLPETHGVALCDTMDQQEDKESVVV